MNAETLHDALTLLPADLITAVDKVRTRPRQQPARWPRFVSMAACFALVLLGSFLAITLFLPHGSNNTSSADSAKQESAMEGAPAEAETQAAAESPAGAAMGTAGEAGEETGSGTSNDAASGSDAAPQSTGYPAEHDSFADLCATQYCLTPQAPGSTLNLDSSVTILIHSRQELEDYCQEWEGYFELYSFYEACTGYDDTWFADHDLLLLRQFTEKSEYRPEVQSLILTGETTREITLSLTEQPADRAIDPACWHILIPVQKDLLADTDTITVILE